MASDTPWSNFTQADYSSSQWARACVIDREEGAPESKDRYCLAVREPSGVVNRHAVHDATSKIHTVQDIPANKRAAAARKLLTMYRTELSETPPDSLMNMVDSGERSAPPLTERAFVSLWQKGGSEISVRKAPDGSPSRIIGGYASVYNKRSEPLGGFVEIVEPSCWNKSRADNWPGVVCRFEHHNLMLLGTTASGTLQLSPDNVGLDYSVDLPECRNDVWEMVQRRDIRNSSFAFQVYDDDFTHDEGMPVRHLLSARLIDVSPVTTPAYLDSSVNARDASIGLRSLADFVGAPYEDVVKLSECNDLRRLFIRTDNNGKPTTKKRSGREALLETLRMEDPDSPIE
jgi:HK97 family phage prohead protease